MPASANHGASTRRPVVYGGKKIPNLTVRALDDGTDVYEVRMRMPDGTHPRVKLDATTPTDAVRERNGLIVDRDRGVEHANPLMNPTVAELLEEWIAAMQTRVGIKDERRRLAPGTVRSHEGRARLHVKPVLGRLRVADVGVRDLRRLISYAEGRKFSPAQVALILQTMSGALRYAFDNGYVERNVAKDLSSDDRPSHKRQTEPRYLTPAEVQRLLAASFDHWRPIYACMAYAALRASETLGLQWECIDFKANTITVRQQYDRFVKAIVPYTKTASSRATLPLLPALKAELLAHRSRMVQIDLQRVRPDAPVFLGPHSGRMISPSASMTALTRTANRAGLNPPGVEPVGQHDLRHSCAAIALAAGASPSEVAELMRHANPRITMTVYAGLNADDRGAAARKLLDTGYGT